MRRKIISIFSISIFILFIYINANSEETEEADLGTVRVVGDLEKVKYKTGDVDHEIASSFYKVIDRSEFEGKTENLAQVIEKETAVQVTQTGGLGSYSTVSLRGSTSKQVSIYLDGILLNEASGGGVDLSGISLDDVESIEIYKGSIPVQYGKSSIGGVINIKTLRNKGKMGWNVIAGYGSFDTRKASAYFSHKPGDWDYLLSVGSLSSQNDFKFLDNKKTKDNPEDDEIVKRNNSQFRQGNFLFKTGYDLTKDLRIDISSQYFDKLQHLPDSHNTEIVNTTFATKRSMSSINYIINRIGKFAINTKGSFDHTWQYERYDDSDGKVGLGKQDNEYITTNTGYSQFIEIPFSWNIIVFNGDFNYERYKMKDLISSRIYNPSTRKSVNFAFEDSVLLFNEDFIIKPSVRYMYIKDSVDEYQHSYNEIRKGQSRSIGYVTPQLGLKYKIFYWLTLKANAGKYVREPSFFELFGDRGLFKGNADLKEEKSTNYDIGFEAEKDFESKILQNLFFSTIYFHSKVDDLITYEYHQGVGMGINISSAVIEGIELSFSIKSLNHIKLNFNYTYQNCIAHSRTESVEGNFLPGRSQESINARVELFNKWILVYYEFIYESGVYYTSDNSNWASDKTEMNAGITFFFKGMSFIFEVKNMGDDNYEDFNGYPQPGRAYYSTVKYQF